MLSQEGLDYICTHFGINDCCVLSGISWTYYVDAVPYPETGGTAQIVGRLAIGLIDYLEINQQQYTQTQLDAANGSSVTLPDVQQIANHDEPSEGQWCVGSNPRTNWLVYAAIAGTAVAVLAIVGMKWGKVHR